MDLYDSRGNPTVSFRKGPWRREARGDELRGTEFSFQITVTHDALAQNRTILSLRFVPVEYGSAKTIGEDAASAHDGKRLEVIAKVKEDLGPFEARSAGFRDLPPRKSKAPLKLQLLREEVSWHPESTLEDLVEQVVAIIKRWQSYVDELAAFENALAVSTM